MMYWLRMGLLVLLSVSMINVFLFQGIEFVNAIFDLVRSK